MLLILTRSAVGKCNIFNYLYQYYLTLVWLRAEVCIHTKYKYNGTNNNKFKTNQKFI